MKWNQVATGLLLGFLILGFTACKSVDIQDGRIPQEYLAEARQLSGVYEGMFNNVLGDLIIDFDGDRPVVTYRNDQDDDILGMNCESSIGALKKVSLKGSRGDLRVGRAVFEFNPGRCYKSVQGREITFIFKQTQKGLRIEAGLLRDLGEQQRCRLRPGTPDTGENRCGTDDNNAGYYAGVFVRN